MENKIKIISVVETNSFADESKSNNGGGYSQPFITFEYDGLKGTLHDTSCGDFGKRIELIYLDKKWNYNEMSDWKNYTDFNMIDDADFAKAVQDEFGIDICKDIFTTKEIMHIILNLNPNLELIDYRQAENSDTGCYIVLCKFINQRKYVTWVLIMDLEALVSGNYIEDWNNQIPDDELLEMARNNFENRN